MKHNMTLSKPRTSEQMSQFGAGFGRANLTDGSLNGGVEAHQNGNAFFTGSERRFKDFKRPLPRNFIHGVQMHLQMARKWRTE